MIRTEVGTLQWVYFKPGLDRTLQLPNDKLQIDRFLAPADHPPLHVAVLISGSGSTLANLIARIRDGRLRGVVITLVISSRAELLAAQTVEATAFKQLVLDHVFA